MAKKVTKINLNEYEKVETREELEDHTGIVLILPNIPDKELYYRKPIKVVEFKDLSEVEWFKDMRISKEGTEAEYASRVDWWFDHAIEDSDYRTILNQTFNRNGYDIKGEWERARNWLKGQTPAARKTYLAKYVWNYMVKGMNSWLYKKDKGWR